MEIGILITGTNSIEVIALVLIFIIGLLVYKYKSKLVIEKGKTVISFDDVKKLANTSGYLYDVKQDIFYTKIDAWQREVGYCRLYDEGAAPLSMIIDCEPIYFEYQGKRWLIEVWKGQYGMTTGCEIGIYNTTMPDLDISDFYEGAFYHAVGDDEMMSMSMTLVKGEEILFKRNEIHWWLTGFVVGEFSNPSDLVMYVSINFPDSIMRDAYKNALLNAGYSKGEIKTSKDKLSFVFDTPRTKQPYTRNTVTDELTQKKNKLLCDEYMEITERYETFPEKIMVIQDKAPQIFDTVMTIGKPKQLYKAFDTIKTYLK